MIDLHTVEQKFSEKTKSEQIKYLPTIQNIGFFRHNLVKGQQSILEIDASPEIANDIKTIQPNSKIDRLIGLDIASIGICYTSTNSDEKDEKDEKVC